MPVVLRLCGCSCVGAIQQSCGAQNKRTEVCQSFRNACIANTQNDKATQLVYPGLLSG